MNALDVLRRARAHFAAAPESYYPHAPARDAGRVGVSPNDPTAVTFSLTGALVRAYGYDLPHQMPAALPGDVAFAWVKRVLGTPKGWRICDWEGTRGRTVADVLLVLDQAVALAEADDREHYARRVYASCNESRDPCPMGEEFELLWGMLGPARHRPEELAGWRARAAPQPSG